MKRLRKSWRTFLLVGALLLLASPFILLNLLVWVGSFYDRRIPGTERVEYKQPDGTPLIAYERLSSGPPLTSIVFVHGTPASANAFSCQITPTLFPGCDLIAYDRPGFGDSPGNEEKASLQYQTSALLALLTHLRTRYTLLVGHSYGAPICVQAACQAPQLITGVVLIGGCLSPAEEHPWTIQYFGNWPVVKSLLPEPARASNEELLTLKADLITLDGMLPQFSCPLLMLHGTRDEEVPLSNVPYTEARMSELGKAGLFSKQIFPNYNHFMMWEHPDVVNPVIQKFVNVDLVPRDVMKLR